MTSVAYCILWFASWYAAGHQTEKAHNKYWDNRIEFICITHKILRYIYINIINAYRNVHQLLNQAGKNVGWESRIEKKWRLQFWDAGKHVLAWDLIYTKLTLVEIYRIFISLRQIKVQTWHKHFLPLYLYTSITSSIFWSFSSLCSFTYSPPLFLSSLWLPGLCMLGRKERLSRWKKINFVAYVLAVCIFPWMCPQSCLFMYNKNVWPKCNVDVDEA